jgi:hypothetical protein
VEEDVEEERPTRQSPVLVSDELKALVTSFLTEAGARVPARKVAEDQSPPKFDPITNQWLTKGIPRQY